MIMKEYNLKKAITVDYSGDKVRYTTLTKTTYLADNNLALVVNSESGDPSEEIGVSVNIRAFYSDDNQFALDVNDQTVNDITAKLVKQGFIKKTDHLPIRSGFVTYPIYQFCIDTED